MLKLIYILFKLHFNIKKRFNNFFMKLLINKKKLQKYKKGINHFTFYFKLKNSIFKNSKKNIMNYIKITKQNKIYHKLFLK